MHQAFNMAQAGPALSPINFTVKCECGQTIVQFSGWNLGVELKEGMDLIGKCRCGREHSLAAQLAEANRLQAEAQGGQQPTPPDEATTSPAEAPKPNRQQRRTRATKAP